MDFESRYEDLRREWPDCMPSPWGKLTATQQTFWIRLFARMDNEESAKTKAYETLGKVVVLNPELLPVE